MKCSVNINLVPVSIWYFKEISILDYLLASHNYYTSDLKHFGRGWVRKGDEMHLLTVLRWLRQNSNLQNKLPWLFPSMIHIEIFSSRIHCTIEFWPWMRFLVSRLDSKNAAALYLSFNLVDKKRWNWLYLWWHYNCELDKLHRLRKRAQKPWVEKNTPTVRKLDETCESNNKLDLSFVKKLWYVLYRETLFGL